MTLPRLLILDHTPIRGPAATSVLKANHFGDWPAGQLLQVTQNPATRRLALTDAAGRLVPFRDDAESAALLDGTFAPQITLYRPTAECPPLHDFALHLLERSQTALALWLMDDWHARLLADHPERGKAWQKDLETLAGRAALNLAISPGMARAFGERYGAGFEVARNVVDLPDRQVAASTRGGSFTIRYAGSLAPDMSLEAIRRLARFVAGPHGERMDLRFDIRTQAHWLNLYGDGFAGLPRVDLRASDLSADAYRQWLEEADLLVAAYNDDEETRRYLRYSFANKVPELLASGRPVLAIGPEAIETVAFLKEVGGAVVTRGRTDSELEAAIAPLIAEPESRQALVRRAREVVAKHFGKETNKAALRHSLVEAAAEREAKPRSIGQVKRKMAATIPWQARAKFRVVSSIASLPGGESAMRAAQTLKRAVRPPAP
jgi:hypothetical protein